MKVERRDVVLLVPSAALGGRLHSLPPFCHLLQVQPQAPVWTSAMTQHQDQPDSREEEVGAVPKTPRLWEFKGHCLRDTFFELRIFGHPNAKALSNVIKQLEITRDFVAEDEAAERIAKATTPTDLGEGIGSERCNGTASDAPSVRPDTGDA
jgi:hypothetical protein